MSVAPGVLLGGVDDENSTPWSAVVTAEEACAEQFRRCGLRAFAINDPLLLAELQPGEPLLLIDKASRAAADLRRRGAGDLWEAQTPAPYRWPSEFLHDRAAVAGCDLSATQLLELAQVIFDRAQLVRVESSDTFPQMTAPRRRARRLDTRAMIAQGPQPMLVQGLLPVIGVGFITGASNAGKTTAAVDLAAHIVAGMPWNGRPTQAGRVIYHASEDPHGIAQRIDAWEQHHNISEIAERIDIWADAPPIDTADGARELAEIITDTQARGGVPALYIIDTLSTSLAGSMDKSEIAAPTMAMLGAAARRARCCVLVVHHPKKPQVGSPGGHGEAFSGAYPWFGAADFFLQVQETFAGIDLLTLKQRNGPKAEPIPLALRPVDLRAGGTGIVAVHRHDSKPTSDAIYTPLTSLDRRPLARAIR